MALLKASDMGGCSSCGKVLMPHMWLQVLWGTLQPWVCPPLGLGVTLSPTCCTQGLYISTRGDLGTVERHSVTLAAPQVPPLLRAGTSKVCTAVLKVGAVGGHVSHGKVLVLHVWLQALGGTLQLQMCVPPTHRARM